MVGRGSALRDRSPDPRDRAAQSSCRLSTGVVLAPNRAIQRSARIGRGAAPVTRENRSKQKPCSELGTHHRGGDRRAGGGPRPCDQFGASICFQERWLCPARDDQSKVPPHSNAVGLLGETSYCSPPTGITAGCTASSFFRHLPGPEISTSFWLGSRLGGSSSGSSKRATVL